MRRSLLLTFHSFADLLAKAKKGDRKADAKYIMRLPTGNPKRPWRYIYDVHYRGKYAHEQVAEGASIKMRDEGTVGQFDVVSMSSTHVKVKHSGTGKTQTFTKKEFRSRIYHQYATEVTAHQDMWKQIVSDTLRYQTNYNMRMRVLEEAARYGITADSGMVFTDEESDEAAAEGMEREAFTLHEDVLPLIQTEVPKEVEYFPNPVPEHGIVRMKAHQVEGAARIIDAWKTGDGCLIADEAGLGKTVTALAATKVYAGKLNIIVVPESGKANLKAGWAQNAALFGTDIEDLADRKTPPKGAGTYVVAYQELFETVMVKDPDTGEMVKKAKLKPQFRASFDTIVFDECHNLRNPESLSTQAAMQLQEKAGKVLYQSATPFTNLTDLHYLRRLGSKDDKAWFSSAEEFVEWAQESGAEVVRTNKTVGDLPFEVKNPRSPEVMASVAALMHIKGFTCKRVPNVKGLSSNFSRLKRGGLPKDEQRTFNAGDALEQIAKKALPDNPQWQLRVGGALTMWRKMMWEAVKAEEAIRQGKDYLKNTPNGQVALFFAFKQHNHNTLIKLTKDLKAKANAAKGEKREMLMESVLQMEHMLSQMKSHEGLIDRVVNAFGGPNDVAQIHGDAKVDSLTEQQAYQRGDKKIMIGTMDKAGTGLDFHDKVGDAPRLQINLTLPWEATKFQQVSGRSHRLGSRSNTKMVWLSGDDPSERNMASIVAAKLTTMGVLSEGDVDRLVSKELLHIFDHSGAISANPAEIEAAIAAAAEEGESDALDTLGEGVRTTFRRAVEGYREGRDPLKEGGERISGSRAKDRDLRARQAASKLIAAGYLIRVHRGRFRILGAQPGTEAYQLLKKQKRTAIYRSGTGEWSISNSNALVKLAHNLKIGHKHRKLTTVPSWDPDVLQSFHDKAFESHKAHFSHLSEQQQRRVIAQIESNSVTGSGYYSDSRKPPVSGPTVVRVEGGRRKSGRTKKSFMQLTGRG